jgi:predicted nucleic acid-binding Zn finger protein
MISEEQRILEAICDEAHSTGKLTRGQWRRLRSLFGERVERAWRLVEEGRVKLYVFEPSGRRAWVAVGKDGEYQILPAAGYCGCSDFYFRVIDGEVGLCYHLIAQRLAEALGGYREIREGDEFYEGLMLEWREQALRGGA